MTLSLKNVIALAKAKNSIPCLQSVIFDGKSACTMANLEWMAGVPCAQSGLTEPVAVPVAAVLAHLAKSRHLFVMPDHLSNGQGLVTAFNPLECADVLEMLPKMPETDSVAFDLELNALDRVLVACGEHDIRYFLNGVMFDLTNGMLVGTDGHRLHAYKNRVPVVYPWDSDERKTKEKDIQYIVKRDPLHWMLKSAQDAAKVTIFDPVIDAADGGPSFLIQADDGFVWVPKAICGQYPDYQRVIPTQSSRSVWFETNPIHFSDALGAMTRAIQLACTTKFTGVVLDLENSQLIGESQHLKAGSMPLEVKTFNDDGELVGHWGRRDWMGFQAPYMIDLADCVTPAAQWRLAESCAWNSSMLVIDGDFSGVVMPCRMEHDSGADPIEPAQESAKQPETVAAADPEPVAAVEVPEPAQAAQEPPEELETPPAEPCPAAVSDIVARLIGKALIQAKPSRQARKTAKPEPVAA